MSEINYPSSQYLSVLRQAVQIEMPSVVYMEGLRNYTRFWLEDGSNIITSKSLAFYEAVLPSYLVRVHKSYVVNMNFVESFSNECLALAGGSIVRVSRRRKKKIVKHSNLCFL